MSSIWIYTHYTVSGTETYSVALAPAETMARVLCGYSVAPAPAETMAWVLCRYSLAPAPAEAMAWVLCGYSDKFLEQCIVQTIQTM